MCGEVIREGFSEEEVFEQIQMMDRATPIMCVTSRGGRDIVSAKALWQEQAWCVERK